MALTRAMLKGMGLTEEQVGAIIEEHTNVTTALKEDIKKYKEDAEKLPAVQKELDKLKNDTSASDWEKKFNDEHTAFEEYKSTVNKEKQTALLKDAYKGLLKECKVNEKHIDAVVRLTDFSKMKLTEDGKLDGADDLKKSIQTDWSEYITTTHTDGADIENPPESDDSPSNTGRAAQLAASYHDRLYGKTKED